jgi:hypothetical protein
MQPGQSAISIVKLAIGMQSRLFGTLFWQRLWKQICTVQQDLAFPYCV